MSAASDGTTVAIIDPFHPRILDILRNALPPSWRLAIAEGRGRAEQQRVLAEARVCFVMATPMDAELIESAPHLRFIQKLGVGTDRIDTDACRRRGIAVARLGGGNDVPVAEHTVLMMLAALRNLPAMDRSVREGHWQKEEARGFSRQISGKTVGLVGFGAIGRAVAGMLAGFRATILYYDPVRAPAEMESRLAARAVDLDGLMRTADIVSLHLPLTRDTAGLIDARRIGMLQRHAVLVNCARGGLVDEAALAAALHRGDILGAAIDTFAQEPPVGSPLLTLPNIVLTPHVAGATLDNFAGVAARAVDNAERLLRGESLPAADVVVAPALASAARKQIA